MQSNSLFAKVLNSINPINKNLEAEIQEKIDNKTKPLGSLGVLEDIARKLCLIQKNLNPSVDKKGSMVFAADHGITEEGVSAFPKEVTQQMVFNFLNGGAAINSFCNNSSIDLKIIDMGVDCDFEDLRVSKKYKIAKGTENFAKTLAMTREQAILAIEKGMEAFFDFYEENPIDIVGLGEMGIGNTSSSSAVISAICNIDIASVVGRGTGIDDAGFNHKIEVLQKAMDLHKPDSNDGLDVLSKVGGYELAGMAGAALAAASKGVAIMFDGLISTAAALIAYRICPFIKDYAFSGHKSVEIGQKTALNLLELRPLLDLNMRLGEGTGAAIAMSIVDNAAAFMRNMASFDDAGVSNE